MIWLTIVLVLGTRDQPRSVFLRPDGSIKILHISDTHFKIPNLGCHDVVPDPYPCGHQNTTDFIRGLVELEQPDLMVFTGDVIDGDTDRADRGLTAVYGIAVEASIPWAASLGNHDDQSSFSRSQVMEFILGMDGTLSQMGPAQETRTFGNFVLDFYPSVNATTPVFRSYHFDSDDDDPESINDAQVAWFREQSANMTHIPSIAFYHIPSIQYEELLNSSVPISGSVNEKVCYTPKDSGIFDAMVAANVRVGYCGHDHVNDFCGFYRGMQLCYEGSPGMQTYGKVGFDRRARVTEIRQFGQTIVSWKRLKDGKFTLIDREVLWDARGRFAGTDPAMSDLRRPIAPETYQALPRLLTKRRSLVRELALDAVDAV